MVSKYIQSWWNRNGWTLIFITSFFILFILWLFYSRHRTMGTTEASFQDVVKTFLRPWVTPPVPPTLNQTPTITTSPVTKEKESKGEKKCREFLEFVTKKTFTKVRPSFLLNPVTQRPLELDMYNEELRLAVEYNGSQHYQYNQMMHGNRDSFHNQKYRDLIKQQLCQQHGIRLICVPYTVSEKEIPLFLYDRLKELKII